MRSQISSPVDGDMPPPIAGERSSSLLLLLPTDPADATAASILEIDVGRLVIDARLATGTLSEVYRGRYEEMDVAVKVVRCSTEASKVMQSNFLKVSLTQPLAPPKCYPYWIIP